jgi:glycosyltransferase involved in cell wall biosynthesis
MRPITIFTPSFADQDNTNAQNLTVKEIVARLPADLFRVVMIGYGEPDPRIAARANTLLLPWRRRGNAVRLLARCLLPVPDVYFFPRTGPLDRGFLFLRRRLRLKTALVTYIVMMMNDATSVGMTAGSIVEADVVVANSHYVAETVHSKFGVDAGIIYDGIDRRFFFSQQNSGAERPSPRPVVLYAGTFQARKRVELVVQQAARWPEVEFRLAGRGETEAACRALAGQLGCCNVSFLGHLTPAQLGDEMRHADVFLFPSVLEGHPQVLGQASACGLPCVAMNVYRPDYVVNGDTGFLVESDAELTQKLELLLRDSALRGSMCEAAVRHARNFDWDRIAGQWQEVFQNVVARRQGLSGVRDLRHL